MNTFNTIEQAMKTNHKVEILSTKSYDHKGLKRVSIRAKKARGKKEYTVIQYENGKYSEAVCW